MKQIENQNSLLVLAGLKGSGKGSTGEYLLNRGLFQNRFDVGSFLRNLRGQIATKSPEDAARLQTSQLVGSEHLDPAVQGFMINWNLNESKILDGYCRIDHQAFKLLAWEREYRRKLNLNIRIAVVVLNASEDCAGERREGRGKAENREDDLNHESRANGIREYYDLTVPALQILRHNGLPYIEISSETGIVCKTKEDKEKSVAIVGERVVRELKKIEFI